MKKFGVIILILTAVCILALAFLEEKIFPGDFPLDSSLDSSITTSKPAPVCAHEWVFESSTATCSRDGEKLYKCLKCSETKTEECPAYGCYDEDKNGLCDGCGISTGECEHKFVTQKGFAATCMQDGLSDKRYCSKCDLILDEHMVITALGHQVAVLEAVPSTCISTGLTEGEHCSRCQLVFKAQDIIPLEDHIGDEGVCTVCNKITDPKLALGFYIVKYGTKRDDRETYFISKPVEKITYTGIVYIEFDPVTSEMVFFGESTTMGIVGNMAMILDMDSDIQRINLEGTYQGSDGYAIGTIDVKNFSPNNMVIDTFEYDAGNLAEDEQLYKLYFSIAISEMLISSAEMIAETEIGVTMPMLGFANY